MEVYIILVTLFLAAVFACGGYIRIHVEQGATWGPPFAKALAELNAWFGCSHKFVAAGLLATGATHAIYEGWGMVAQSPEAPIALGIAVMIGYVATFIGLVWAWNQGRSRDRHLP